MPLISFVRSYIVEVLDEMNVEWGFNMASISFIIVIVRNAMQQIKHGDQPPYKERRETISF